MSTLKQDAVVERIAANGFNLKKTMLEVGYAPGSAISGNTRQHVLKHLKKYYDADFVRKEYKRLYKKCDKKEDISNQAKVLDSMARTEAMFTDKTINDTNITLNDADKAILTKYGMLDLT